MIKEVRTTRVLTPAQRALLIAMFKASPTRLHYVKDLGFKKPVLDQLVYKGYATYSTDWKSDAAWKGKLTAVGRREAKLLIV